MSIFFVPAVAQIHHLFPLLLWEFSIITHIVFTLSISVYLGIISVILSYGSEMKFCSKQLIDESVALLILIPCNICHACHLRKRSKGASI